MEGTWYSVNSILFSYYGWTVVDDCTIVMFIITYILHAFILLQWWRNKHARQNADWRLANEHHYRSQVVLEPSLVFCSYVHDVIVYSMMAKTVDAAAVPYQVQGSYIFVMTDLRLALDNALSRHCLCYLDETSNVCTQQIVPEHQSIRWPVVCWTALHGILLLQESAVGHWIKKR